MRNAVVDDACVKALRLLRICPWRGGEADQESQFLNMPTYYGPVDLKVRLTAGGEDARRSSPARSGRRRSGWCCTFRLFRPESVLCNGKTLKWDGKRRRS